MEQTQAAYTIMKRTTLFVFVMVVCYNIFAAITISSPSLNNILLQTDTTLNNSGSNAIAFGAQSTPNLSYNEHDFSFLLHQNGQHFYGTDEGDAKYYDKHDLNISRSFMYCSIAKCGSTFWFSVWSQFIHAHQHTKHGILLLDMQRRNELLRDEHIFKFVFVRDPLERLYSSYLDKCASGGRYAAQFCGARDEATLISFLEFTRYIYSRSLSEGVNHINGHWIPQAFYCDLYKHVAVWNVYQLGNMQHTQWIFGNISLKQRYEEYARHWFSVAATFRDRNVTQQDIWSLVPFTFKNKAIHSSKRKQKEPIERVYSLSMLDAMLRFYSVDYILFDLALPVWICSIMDGQNLTYSEQQQRVQLSLTINTFIPTHLWPQCLQLHL